MVAVIMVLLILRVAQFKVIMLAGLSLRCC